MASRVRIAAVGVLLVVLVATGAAVAEETPQAPHQHPDDVDDDEDLEGLQRWLGDGMGTIHADCTEGISVGSFDACEDLDDEYESFLERYVDVERETTDEDDRAGETFDETRENHAEYAELVEEFETTLEEYQDARAAGDEERARELARELRSLADRIEELGGELEVRFRFLDARTAVDLDAAADATRESTDETVTIVEEVERESFDSTTLSVDANRTAAFDAPAAVSGRLTDEDGEPVTDGRVVLETGERRLTARTDGNGGYEFAYRPTVAPLGESTLTVRYVPADAAPYLGSNASTVVRIEETDSEVELTSAASEAAFDDPVPIEGTVRSAGEPAPNVAVTVTVSGERLASTRTADDGAFAVDPTLPADVPSGDAELHVRASEEGLALAPSRAAREIAIVETPTRIDANTTASDGTVALSGALTTDDGTAVEGRPISITVDGERSTATTDADGRFRAEFPTAATERTATVRYDGTGSNLGSSETAVVVPADESGTAGGDSTAGLVERIVGFVGANPLLSAAAGVAAVGLIAGAVAALARRGGVAALADLGGRGEDAPTATAKTTSETSSASSVDADASAGLLELAREQLDSRPDAAVRNGYAAVRSRLDDGSARTHWEFYREAGAGLDDRRRAALRSVTEAFEAATFSPSPIGSNRARAAIEDAERCLSATDGGEDEQWPTTDER